jgi:hypothetical protein
VNQDFAMYKAWVNAILLVVLGPLSKYWLSRNLQRKSKDD